MDMVTDPSHYDGDGLVSAKRAGESMLAGYAEGGMTVMACVWAFNALKYLWRAPLKGDVVKDLRKARQCIDYVLAEVG